MVLCGEAATPDRDEEEALEEDEGFLGMFPNVDTQITTLSYRGFKLR